MTNINLSATSRPNPSGEGRCVSGVMSDNPWDGSALTSYKCLVGVIGAVAANKVSHELEILFRFRSRRFYGGKSSKILV